MRNRENSSYRVQDLVQPQHRAMPQRMSALSRLRASVRRTIRRSLNSRNQILPICFYNSDEVALPHVRILRESLAANVRSFPQGGWALCAKSGRPSGVRVLNETYIGMGCPPRSARPVNESVFASGLNRNYRVRLLNAGSPLLIGAHRQACAVGGERSSCERIVKGVRSYPADRQSRETDRLWCSGAISSTRTS